MVRTEGLTRGLVCESFGSSIKVPVGENITGRLFDAIGHPIDNKGEVNADAFWPIHRHAPSFTEQYPAETMLETGIKVIDLLVPFSRGGKIGLFGGAGVGKTVLILELIRNLVLHLITRGPLLTAIGKAAHMVESDFIEEFHRLFEVFLGFARETGDQGSP